MISETQLNAAALKAIEGNQELFLVGTVCGKDNTLEVTIESLSRSVTLDDCVMVSRSIEATLDRDREDFELTVTSAGLDQPFKVAGQYEKALGSEVEILLRGGRKIVGILSSYSEESIEVTYSALKNIEGKKRRVRVDNTETIAAGDINSVRYHLIFK